MTFFNATLIFGTLAAVVPIALHMLAKREPQRVVFPGVQFLRPKLTTQRSQLQVRRWWLLALRILAVMALALALARPHIASAAASTWWTIGLVGATGVGFLVLASVAIAKGMGRSLAIGMAIAGVVALLGSMLLATRAWANSEDIDLGQEQPVAMALLIDNGPSSARQASPNNNSTSTANGGSSDAGMTRLRRAIGEAIAVMDRLPEGSRLVVLDRSATPVGFSLDIASARVRLSQIQSLPNPLPMDERMRSAVELLRSSDLPGKQLVVVSDWNAETWARDGDSAEASWDDVAVTLLQIDVAEEGADSAADRVPLNRFLTTPKLVDAAPAPQVPIPVSMSIGVEAGSNTGDAPADSLSVTVQMSLYDRDPTLPVIRDGEVVLPSLRRVDRASVRVSPGAQADVVMTLPPLELGIHHAVIELIGNDGFAWDDRRYLTIHLPTPPRVLLVGENVDERNLLGAALTAPQPPDDDSAGIRVAGISYQDLSAVDWDLLDAVVLIDPPLRVDGESQRVLSHENLSQNAWQQVVELAERGGGALVLLGPSMEVVGVPRPKDRIDAADENATRLPDIVRSWRVPEPGTFLDVQQSSHPALRALEQLDDEPAWNAFRIHRYWQCRPKSNSGWQIPMQFAGTEHPAMLTRTIKTSNDQSDGRLLIMTTPLPALAAASRSWNELFSGSDPWPAFVTWRSMVHWATGVTDSSLNALVGAAVVVPDQDPAIIAGKEPVSQEAEASRVLVFPPVSTTVGAGETTDVAEVSLGEQHGVFVGNGRLGTTFLRGPNYWGGFSTNLDPVWSVDERAQPADMDRRFGSQQWTPSSSGNELSIQGRLGGSPPVSLHGPMMLLAVIVFLGEQLLSNRFYRRAGEAI
ncbi:BatA domain-containing protein [Rhodopirellula halodulae]|uniref:BatA domain-containing protein n=1 Tax=Rhodopirellula halodulae TaxID=2894198 RepID=UPI001E391153|nr:BatA domain-containing protein [Rhodopirellula sp. JC737]MCC9654354.1 BatA domain-containing protein [Rhodopirellula sp. JC737]